MTGASNVVGEPSKAAAEGYRSITFESGAPHEKYFGWTELVVEPGLKIIARQRGPVRRCLILAQGIQFTRLDETVRHLRLMDARTDLVLHDFDDPGRSERVVANQVWRRIPESERLLNKATFVFDLARDDEAIIKSMDPNYRRDLRKAREAGLRVEADNRPAPETFQEFTSSFEAMVRGRGLRSPGRLVLRRMFDGGDLTLFRVLAGNVARASAAVYRANDKAIWIIGVDGGKAKDGAGRILQFEIMRRLRSQNVRWYDLGGVASTDEGDGIYKFKKGFGGAFVSLGAEYFRRPPLVRALVRIRRSARDAARLWRRAGSRTALS